MRVLLLLVFSFTIITSITAQDATPSTTSNPWYISQESEMIFSFASFDLPDGFDIEQNMRWSPVFNFAGHANYDVSENFGLNIGLGIRNVGFIAKFDSGEDQNIDRVKYRTYNLGIPVGFKVGNLDQKKPFFLFAGYEFELPFHYKQKEFDGNDKVNKITGWFSDRSATVQNSLYAGVQLPQGFSLKFKYYLTGFFNEDFTQNVEGSDVPVKPYDGFTANVFYFSITAFPFKDIKSYKEDFKNL